MQLVDHLAPASARFAALLREASPAIDARSAPAVPSCPGWDLADLAVHLGGVHRWALDAIAAADPGRPPDERVPATPPDAAALLAWFEQGAAALLAALESTDPARPCWGFGPHPRTAAFWQRRMPHETTLHAWDAAQALGRPEPLHPQLAADGVDEVVHMFVPRQVRLGRLEPLDGHVELRADDVQGWGPWHLAPPGAGSQPPDAVVSAPAATLLPLLWRRERLDAADAVLDGAAHAAHRMFAAPLTP